jgi:hypothetical protein
VLEIPPVVSAEMAVKVSIVPDIKKEMNGVMAKEKFYNVCYGRIKSPTMPRQTALEFTGEIIKEKGESVISGLFCNEKPVSKAVRLKFIKEARENLN